MSVRFEWVDSSGQEAEQSLTWSNHPKLKELAEKTCKAAEEGSAAAMLKMAKMYDHGLGCEKNHTYSYYWYTQALKNPQLTPEERQVASIAMIKMHLILGWTGKKDIRSAAEIFSLMPHRLELEELRIRLNPPEAFEFAYWRKDHYQMETLLDLNPALDLAPFFERVGPDSLLHLFDFEHPHLPFKVWERGAVALSSHPLLLHRLLLNAIDFNFNDLLESMIERLPAKTFASKNERGIPLFGALLLKANHTERQPTKEATLIHMKARKRAEKTAERILLRFEDELNNFTESSNFDKLRDFVSEFSGFDSLNDPSMWLTYLCHLCDLGKNIVESLAYQGDRYAELTWGFQLHFNNFTVEDVQEKILLLKDALTFAKRSAEKGVTCAYIEITSVIETMIPLKHPELTPDRIEELHQELYDAYEKAAEKIDDLIPVHQAMVLDWLITFWTEKENTEKVAFYLKIKGRVGFSCAEEQLKSLQEKL